MSNPIPDPDQEAALREEIRQAIKDRWDLLTGPALDHGAPIVPGAWRRKDLCGEFTDTVVAGPLATLLARATAAEAERDEARRQMRENMVPISKDGSHVFIDGMGDVALDWSQGNDLIALAKMYGEACGRLHQLGFLMAENVVIEVVEDDEQGRELLAGIEAITAARDAAEATLREKEAEVERLRTALKPFAQLWFSFDGFSAEQAELVFNDHHFGRWSCRHHTAFEALIRGARAAITPKSDEVR